MSKKDFAKLIWDMSEMVKAGRVADAIRTLQHTLTRRQYEYVREQQIRNNPKAAVEQYWPPHSEPLSEHAPYAVNVDSLAYSLAEAIEVTPQEPTVAA